MRALVFGRTGQVATELCRRAPEYDIVVEALDRAAADLSDPELCAELVRRTDADVVINVAAYTAVDKAEEEKKLAQLINADAPGAIARAAAERGLPFLHVSTDYVFDGKGTAPRKFDDQTDPLGTYGKTKQDGERQIAQAGGWHVILRTSWVFSSHGNNFVKTILRLSETRDSLSIVSDQVGGPTAASDIADVLLTIAKKGKQSEGGVYHYSGTPSVSWAEFAGEIAKQSGLSVKIENITTRDYPTLSARPLNSRLDCSRTYSTYGISQPNWKISLAQVLAELNAAQR